MLPFGPPHDFGVYYIHQAATLNALAGVAP